MMRAKHTCSKREKLPKSMACVNSPPAFQPNCCTMARSVPRSSDLSASLMNGPSKRLAVAASTEGSFKRLICSSNLAKGLDEGLSLPRLCPDVGVLTAPGLPTSSPALPCMLSGPESLAWKAPTAAGFT